MGERERRRERDPRCDRGQSLQRGLALQGGTPGGQPGWSLRGAESSRWGVRPHPFQCRYREAPAVLTLGGPVLRPVPVPGPGAWRQQGRVLGSGGCWAPGARPLLALRRGGGRGRLRLPWGDGGVRMGPRPPPDLC